jgi:hypothetical protein
MMDAEVLLQEGLVAAGRWVRAPAGSAEASSEAGRATTALIALDAALRSGAQVPVAWRDPVPVDEPGETVCRIWPRQGNNGWASGAGT